MATSKTLQNLRDSVRFAVRRQTTAVLMDADIDPLINEGIRDLWVLCAKLNRDEYWKVSSSFTITAGQNTKTIAAIGITDFLDLRGVDIDVGSSNWMPLRPYRFSRRGYVGELSYRLRGSTLEVLPLTQASIYPYRIHYVYQPTALAAGSDTVDLPLVGDTYVIHSAAAKVRPTFEEDPGPHLDLMDRAAVQVKRWLVEHGQGPAETPAEADPYDDAWPYGDW